MEGVETKIDFDFYKGKKVLVTGHTGFKGAWMCRILLLAGANVIGYSLDPPTETNLFDLAELQGEINDVRGDIRDFNRLKNIVDTVQPEIVFHLAAQPIVRLSYEQPLYTYETNVMGTVNLLESIRTLKNPVKSVINVTTDKVYSNKEWIWGYREDEQLDGFEPYSNSKSCSELVTHSYINSFFRHGETAVSTARAGNVIGGGDFARDRIVPDCIRAVVDKKPILVRNPDSTRPYQHVLEPVVAYLMLAQRQYEEKTLAGYYNIGPDDYDCMKTAELVDLFCKCWGEDAKWECCREKDAPHEANFLKLDCSKIKSALQWHPTWHMETAVDMVCRWTKCWLSGGNICKEMDYEIFSFCEAIQ